MAHTTAIVGSPPYRVEGAQRRVTADITQSTTYATNGEAITAAELGLNVIEEAEARLFTTVATATGVECVPVIAATGSTLNLKVNTAAGEAANAAPFIGSVIRLVARGK